MVASAWENLCPLWPRASEIASERACAFFEEGFLLDGLSPSVPHAFVPPRFATSPSLVSAPIPFSLCADLKFRFQATALRYEFNTTFLRTG